METLRYELDADGIVTITFDEPARRSTRCAGVAERPRRRRRAGASPTRRDRGILLASAKKTFFAGADLKERARSKRRTRRAGFAEIALTKSFRTLETLGKPVVALPQRHGAGRRLGESR